MAGIRHTRTLKIRRNRNPSLYVAIYKRRLKAMKTLLDAGADLLKKNVYGNDAYSYME